MASPVTRHGGYWTIGVTGATGLFGRMILQQLLDHFHWPPAQLVAICRDCSKNEANEWRARGLQVREADFGDDKSPAVMAAHPKRVSLVEAYRGIDRLIIVSVDTLANWYQLHANAINAAVAAGVKHIVYTSSPTLPVQTPPLTPLPAEDPLVENLLHGCGRGYTILGNNIWYDDLVDKVYKQMIAGGTIYTLDANGRAAHVSKLNCALAAATVLTQPNAPSRKIEISGPQVLTRQQFAEKCTEYHLGPQPNGRVNVVEMDEPKLKDELLKMMQNDAYVQAVVAFDKAYSAGNFARVDGGFQELTGTRPESFDDFLKRRARPTLASGASSGSAQVGFK